MTARELARLELRLLALAAATASVACLVASHLLWNCTPSLPIGLYWLSRGAPARVGALVAFPIPERVRALTTERRYLPRGAFLVKPVVALPPDRVCTAGGTLAVDGVALGAIPTKDTAGRPLPQDHICGPLPERLAYVASHFPTSFDSRTFGPVPLRDLRGTVTPLWTF